MANDAQPPDQPLMTQAEVAALLRVSRTTLWRLVVRGELAQIRIGRRALIVRSSVDSFIAAQLRGEDDDVTEV